MEYGMFVIAPAQDGYVVELRLADGRTLSRSVEYTTLDSAKRAIRSIIEYAPSVPTQDNTVREVKREQNPKFEIFSTESSYFFRFRARNGKQTITSCIFTSPFACRQGIAAVQAMVKTAPIYIEVEDELVPIDTYTQQQIALFDASKFRKEAEWEAMVAEQQKEEEKKNAKGLRGFFRRLFG